MRSDPKSLTSSTDKVPSQPLTITLPALLSEGSDQPFRKLVHTMLAMSARLLAVRNGFGALVGLSGPQFSILITIAHSCKTGEVTVNDVAEHLHLSGAFVTIETGKLQKAGLIEKTTHLVDRRKTCLVITTRGRTLLGGIAPYQQQINDVLFDEISADDFRTLSRVMERMVIQGDRATFELKHLTDRMEKSKSPL